MRSGGETQIGGRTRDRGEQVLAAIDGNPRVHRSVGEEERNRWAHVVAAVSERKLHSRQLDGRGDPWLRAAGVVHGPNRRDGAQRVAGESDVTRVDASVQGVRPLVRHLDHGIDREVHVGRLIDVIADVTDR